MLNRRMDVPDVIGTYKLDGELGVTDMHRARWPEPVAYTRNRSHGYS